MSPIPGPLVAELNFFRELCIRATYWSLGPKRVEGWDGSKAKDESLSVLARRRDVLTEIRRSSSKAKYRLGQSNLHWGRDALDEEHKVVKTAQQCADRCIA